MNPPPNVPDPSQPPYGPPQGYVPPQQPVPVYYQQPPVAPSWNPGRAAGNTVVVIVTLVGIFCVLPVVLCTVLGLLGNGLDRH